MYSLFNRDCIDLTDIQNVTLIYMDPPYSSRKDKDGGMEDVWYGIGDTFEEYLDFIKQRLIKVKSCLNKDANVIVHVDWKAAGYIRVIGDQIFGRSNFRNQIAWCYSSPSVAKRWLPRKTDTLLWWGMGNYPFHEERISYNGKLKVGGKTSWNPNVDEKDYLDKGKLLEDYWTDCPSLCRNEQERLGYPTQKPLKLMRRIVSMFSNPGDLIMDPFCGSGSFLHAAIELDRHAIGIDISKEAIELTEKRLKGITK
jgi:DNA modification methylase